MMNLQGAAGSACARSSLALDGIRVLVVDDESQTEMYVFALERLGAPLAPATMT